MRIVSIGEASTCRHYRSRAPLEGLSGRGHLVRFVESLPETMPRATNDPREIAGADVILGYRMLFGNSRLVRQGIADGSAFVWDVDDDFANLPHDSVTFKAIGRAGVRWYVRHCVELARMADVVTTTTPVLAAKYRRLGARRVVVIDNHLPKGAQRKVKRAKRDVVTIGWVASGEHRVDAKRVPVLKALRRLLEEQPHVRVESAGVELRLPADRYRHYSWVDINRLPDLLSRWDIGIAPLADIPFNRARSDVKLKEYGACGLPWLASPVGPYVNRGEQQGGRLVADHGWHDALTDLVEDPDERHRLGALAYDWAETQSIRHAAAQWEQVCQEAVERSARRRG